MLKHIGRHGDRKVAIVFRALPGEDHMCLVVYPDTLPSHIDMSIMKVLESPAGQQENVLAEALHRNLLPDGRAILEALHREGMLKKVPSSQVIVTPTATSSVRLDELNRLVKEMEQGEGAAKRMAELDASTGLVDPAVKRKAEQEFKRKRLEQEATRQGQNIPAVDSNTLDDRTLAGNMLTQAVRMEAEAKGLLSESARMKKDAERMFPGVSQSDASAATPMVAAKKIRSRKKAIDAVQ